MRFTLDGLQFELTAEQVRARLASCEPAEIRQHWVEVDGRRWPVKQALAIATGVDRSRFVSTTARRHLGRLGFATSEDGRQRASKYRGTTRHREVFDVSALPSLEQLDASVSFVWRDAGQVTLDGQGLPRFPRLPSTPGLYRFDFRAVDGSIDRTIYIGESQDLARRGSN
ncbi:hypothetical protein [Kribbella rubisoli]|uniref:hypothetical protein n=1 Tax=Kribbella rubisoli TaxID=3075929 RepID=UPI00102AA934|nr:hypothetical protein [Kribbella rubisoli]